MSGPINIKPSHKGLLTKKSGNTTLEREIVFAQNARRFKHPKKK